MQAVVKVEKRVSPDWPHGRIKVSVGDTWLRLTPNQARRLSEYLNAAVAKAEWKQ